MKGSVCLARIQTCHLHIPIFQRQSAILLAFGCAKHKQKDSSRWGTEHVKCEKTQLNLLSLGNISNVLNFHIYIHLWLMCQSSHMTRAVSGASCTDRFTTPIPNALYSGGTVLLQSRHNLSIYSRLILKKKRCNCNSFCCLISGTELHVACTPFIWVDI